MKRDWLRNSKRKAQSAPRVRRVRDHNVNFEGGASGFVRNISSAEFTDGHTDSEVGNVFDFIKSAKAEDNHVQGLVSKNVEASSLRLDIVWSCELFVKLAVLGKTKRLTCLVFVTSVY